jgi:hypothetical protein
MLQSYGTYQGGERLVEHELGGKGCKVLGCEKIGRWFGNSIYNFVTKQGQFTRIGVGTWEGNL